MQDYEEITFFPIRSFKVQDVYYNKVGGAFNYDKYGIKKDADVPTLGPYLFHDSGNIYEG
jgi:hypothetical protein